MDRLEIRRAANADIPAIAHIINEAWKAGYAGIVPQQYLDAMREADKAKRLREGIARMPHMRYYVLCIDGVPAGTANLHRTQDDDLPDAAEFSFFYFLPALWRRGYGSLLLGRLMHDAAEAGFHRLCCWVLEGNRRAVAFYESRGLPPDGARQTVSIGGAALETVRCAGPL